MDRFSLSFGLAVGFEFLRTCSSFPINYEDALTDSSTWLGVSVVLSLAFVVVGILFLAGCLCCRRESNGFKEFRNSVSTSNLSQVGVGFTNPALSASNQRCITGSSELSIFPPAGAAAAVTFEPLPTHLQPLPPPVQPSHAFSKPPAFAGQATNQEFSITDWFAAGSNFPRDQLHYLREYGRGWFGRVVEGEARSVGEDGRNCKVVVRILREDATPSEQKFFLNEVKTFRDLSHPNVLKLVARCLETDPYLILLESCSSGDLKSFLCGNVASRTALCEQGICLRMMCDIANGLQHIIQNGFVHTDLAARNCLVTSDLTVKVGDYGTSIEMYKDDYYIAGDVALPIRWCAPESLHCTDTTIETKQVTSCANVWSFGVVLWEVCEFGALPYTSLSDDQVIVRVLGRERLKLAPPTHPSLHTAHLYSLMQMCWNEESSRPSLDHVIAMLKHLQMSRTSDSDDNFERRWETLKPNTIPVTDNATTPDALTIRSDFDSGVDLDLKASSDHDLKASNLDLKLSTDLDSSKLKLNTSATASPQLSVASSSGGEFFSPASTKFARQLSPSLTNLRGSFEDITVEVRVPSPLQQPSIAETPLSESEQFDSWLQGVDTTDEEEVKFVKNISEAIRDLDNRLAMEKTSSSSEASSRHESPAKEANAPQQNPVLDFRLGPITCLESRPLVQQLDSLQEDSLLVRRDSSSDTEEETWRGRIERGEFTEKVKEKSKSVADLMILTHIENSSDESDSLPSLTRQYSIEKNRRFVMGKTLAVPMMTSIGFGSEGNIRGAVLGEEFQESLKLLQTAWKIREAESRQASLTVDQVQNEPCVTASALNDEGGNFLGDTASENIFVQNVVGEGRGSCDSSQVKVGGVESECRENEVVSNLVSSSVGDFEDSQKKCVEIQKKSEIVEPMSLVRKSGDIVSSGVENLEDNQEKCVEIEKEARIVERIRNLECTTGDTEERGGSIDVKVRKNEVASNLVSSSVENVANFEENIQGKCVEIEKEGKFVDTMSTVDEKVIKKSEDNEREDKGIVSISELQENGKVLNIRSEDVEEEKETQIITPTSPIKENVKLFLEYGNINKEKNNIVNFTSPVQEYIKTSLKPEDIEGDIELSMKHENIKDKKTEVVNSTSPIFENKNVPVRSEDIGEEKSQVIDFTSQIQNNEKPSDSTNVATDEILSGLKCDDIQSKFAGVENVFEGNIDTTSRNATQEDEPAYKFSSKQDGSESSIEQVLGASSQHLGLEKSDSSKFEKEESDASCGISSRVKREAPQFDEHFLDKKDDVVVADKLSGGRKHDRKVENVNIDEFSPEMESDNMLKDKSSETFLVHEFLSRERGEIVAPVLTSHGSNYVEDYTTTNIIQPIESSKQDSTSLQDPNYLEEDCTTSIQPIETSKQDDSSSPQDSKYVEEDCSTSLQSTESSKQDFIPLKQTDKSSSIKIGNGIEGIDLYSTENNGASSTEIQIDITGNKGVCNTNIQTEITENNGIYNTDIQSVDAVTGNESVCNSDIQTEITENIDLCSTECYEAVKNELEMNDVMDSLPESERIYENDLVDVTNKESPDDVTSDIASSVQSPVDGSTGLLQDNLDSKETSLSELESSSQSSEQTMTVVENDPLKNDEVEMNSNSDLSVVVNGAGKLPEIVVTEAVDVELVQISQDVDNVSANYEYKPRRQIRILISNDSSDDTDSENDCDIFDDSKVPIVVSALNSASSNEPLQQKEMEIKKLDLEKSFNTSDAINIFSLDEEGGAVDKLKAINVDPNVEDNKQSSSNINESYSVILGSCEDYTLDYFKGLKTTSGKPATFDSDYSTNELSKSDSEIEDTDVSSTDREDNINNWDTFLTNSLKDKVEQDENTFNVQFNVQQLDSVGSSDVNSEDTVIDDENEESLRLNKKNLDFSRENNNLINEKNLNSRLLARDYENRNSQIIQDGGRSFVFDGNFQTKDQDRQMNEIKSRLEDVAKLSEGFQLKGAVEEEEDEGKLLTPDDERSSDSGFRDKGSLSESVEDACDEKYNLEDIEAELEEAYTKTNTESKYFSLHDENSSSSGEFSALVSFPNPCSSNKIEVADLGSDKDVKKSMEEIECLPVKDDKSGWFLHPHRATTEDDNMSGWYPSPATPELVKDDSNRSFRLDEELDAIRNELQEKLPCAQQILRDADEDNSPEEERADMVIEYGSYPIPLSPILEERESVSSNQSSIILDLHSSNVSSGRSSPMLMLERNDSFDEDEVGRKFEEDIRSALDLYSSDSIESDEVVDIVVEDLESKEETTMKVEEGKQEYDEDLLIVNTETNEAHLLESPRPKSHLAFVKKSKTTDKNCSPNVNTYTPDSISPISTGSSRTGVALSFSSPDTGNLSSFLSPSSMNSEHVDSCEYSCNIDVDVDRMKDFVPNCFDHSEMFDRLKELEDESSESSQASSERTISVPGFKEGNLENDLNSRKEGNLDVEEWENDLEIGKEENLDVKGWEKDLKIGKEGKRDVKLDKVQESFARREKENDKEELINGCVSKEKLINDCVNKEELIDFINKEKLMNDSANKEELIDCVNKKELNDSVNQEELKNVPTDLVLEKLLETKLSNSLSVDEKLVQEEVVEESKDWLKSVLLPLTNSTVQSEPVTSCTVLPKNSWPSSDELIPDSKCEGDADKKKIELNSTLALLSPNLSVGTTESMVSSFSSTPTFDTTKSLADAQMSLSISSTDGGDSQRVLVPSLRALASEVLRLHKKVLKPISDEGYSAPSKKSLTLALDSAASALSKVPMPSPEDADKGVWKPTVNQLMDLTNQSEHDAESDDLMTTSFIDGDGDNDHYNPDWESDTSDGDSEDHSSSSGEFIWKSQDDIADQQQVGMARIDEEDEEGAEDASSCGSATEFVPSIWDKAATPTKSALRRRLDDNKQESKKSVCFKEQEYHCVYEYPGEPSDSDEDDDEMDSRKRNWETPTNVDYSCFADWELAEGEAVSDRDITDLSADDYAQKSHSNKQKKNDYDFYQLGSVDYDFTQMTTDDGEFFISSSARPFQQMGFSDGSSSEFFPGSRLSFDLEDEATNQYGPENKAELNSVTEKFNKEFINNEKAVINNLSGDVGGSEQQVGVGGLRHTREWLKLDLPATFTSQTTKLELPVTFNSQSTAVNEEKQLGSQEKESAKPTFTSQSTEPDLPVTFSCQSTAVNEENQPKSQEKELPKPKFTSQSTEPDLPVTFSSQSTAVNEDKQLKSQEKESTKPNFTSQSTKLDLPVTFSTQSTAVNEEKQLKSQETESPKLEVDLKVSTVMQEANQIDVA